MKTIGIKKSAYRYQKSYRYSTFLCTINSKWIKMGKFIIHCIHWLEQCINANMQQLEHSLKLQHWKLQNILSHIQCTFLRFTCSEAFYTINYSLLATFFPHNFCNSRWSFLLLFCFLLKFNLWFSRGSRNIVGIENISHQSLTTDHSEFSRRTHLGF